MRNKKESFKEKIKRETNDEVKRLQKIGCVLVSLETIKEILKEKYGLYLDKDTFLKYYDTANEYNHLSLTHTPKDKKGFGWCNIKSEWYNNNCKKRTELYEEWQRERNEYFCINKGHIMFLG